ncbi:MAG: hypothetical protein JW754_01935 [Candidatus Aenigmarchaeota archaeon]|nr:hypothetical protein [Candidatus Aenigmarchaeota archaeon]
MAYKNDRIFILGFGEHKGESISSVPLHHWEGYWYLKDSNFKQFLNDYDQEQINHVVNAFHEFPVLIRCCGKYGECNEVSVNLAIPWEKRKKHEKQGGPEYRQQFELGSNPFFCTSCYEEFAHRYSDGSRGLGVEQFPISFEIFTDKDNHKDWNLGRGQLHDLFRRIAYQLIEKEIFDVIDVSNLDRNQRILFDKKNAKFVVDKLLNSDDVIGFGSNSRLDYKESTIYTLSQRSSFAKKRKKKPALDPNF